MELHGETSVSGQELRNWKESLHRQNLSFSGTASIPSLVFVIFQGVDFAFSNRDNINRVLQYTHKDDEAFQVAYT